MPVNIQHAVPPDQSIQIPIPDSRKRPSEDPEANALPEKTTNSRTARENTVRVDTHAAKIRLVNPRGDQFKIIYVEGFYSQIVVTITVFHGQKTTRVIPWNSPNWDSDDPNKEEIIYSKEILWNFSLNIHNMAEQRLGTFTPEPPHESLPKAQSLIEKEFAYFIHGASDARTVRKERENGHLVMFMAYFHPKNVLTNNSFVADQRPGAVSLQYIHEYPDLHKIFVFLQEIQDHANSGNWSMSTMIRNEHAKRDTQPDKEHTGRTGLKIDDGAFNEQMWRLWDQQQKYKAYSPEDYFFILDKKKGGSSKNIMKMGPNNIIAPEQRPRIKWTTQLYFPDYTHFILPLGMALHQEIKESTRITAEVEALTCEVRCTKFIQGQDDIYYAAIRLSDECHAHIDDNTNFSLWLMIDNNWHGPWRVDAMDRAPFVATASRDFSAIIYRPRKPADTKQKKKKANYFRDDTGVTIEEVNDEDDDDDVVSIEPEVPQAAADLTEEGQLIPGNPPYILDVSNLHKDEGHQISNYFLEGKEHCLGRISFQPDLRPIKQMLNGLRKINPWEITKDMPVNLLAEELRDTLLGQNYHALKTVNILQNISPEAIEQEKQFLKPGQNQIWNYVKQMPKDYGIMVGIPGSGKTRTNTALTAAYFRAGQRVLIIASTNENADSVTLRINEHFKQHGITGDIIRLYSTPTERHFIGNISRNEHLKPLRYHTAKPTDVNPDFIWSEVLNNITLQALVSTNATHDKRFTPREMSLPHKALEAIGLGNLSGIAVDIDQMKWKGATAYSNPKDPISTMPHTTDVDHAVAGPSSTSSAMIDADSREQKRKDKKKAKRKVWKQNKDAKKNETPPATDEHSENRPAVVTEQTTSQNEPVDTAMIDAALSNLPDPETGMIAFDEVQLPPIPEKLPFDNAKDIAAQMLLQKKSGQHWTKDDQEQFNTAWKEVLFHILEGASVIIGTPFQACQANVAETSFNLIIGEEFQHQMMYNLLPILASYPQVPKLFTGDADQLGCVPISNNLRSEEWNNANLERLNREADVFAGNIISREIERGRPTLRLTTNYRAHPDIVDCHRRVFYQDEHIVAGRDRDEFPKAISVLRFFQTKGWNTHGKPIVFIDLDTDDEKTGSNQSSRNPANAVYVLNLVRDLLVARNDLAPEDLMILSPYQAQSHEHRSQQMEMDDPAVARVPISTVGKAIGKEADIVIFDLVRSSNPGFVKKSDLLLTAVSRPQSALIVVGNITGLKGFAVNKMTSLRLLINWAQSQELVKNDTVADVARYDTFRHQVSRDIDTRYREILKSRPTKAPRLELPDDTMPIAEGYLQAYPEHLYPAQAIDDTNQNPDTNQDPSTNAHDTVGYDTEIPNADADDDPWAYGNDNDDDAKIPDSNATTLPWGSDHGNEKSIWE